MRRMRGVTMGGSNSGSGDSLEFNGYRDNQGEDGVDRSSR